MTLFLIALIACLYSILPLALGFYLGRRGPTPLPPTSAPAVVVFMIGPVNEQG